MKKIIIFTFLMTLLQSLSSEIDLNLRDKIGEMLIVGFHETEFEEGTIIAENILKHHIGGIILFSRNIVNPEQLKILTDKLKSYSSKNKENDETELFIAIDQEGGFVSRLPVDRGFLEEDISAKELGNINNPSFTYVYSKNLGNHLKDFGINLNFAPVIDLGLNENNFIFKKERCFSTDANSVFDQATAFIEGMKDNGIITSLKHFPGHGSSDADTHHGLADITLTWNEIELEPYKKFIQQNFDHMIMISHVVNKNLDPDELPSTFSKKIVTHLLREQMQFQGVIISDDLTMGAITNEYSLEETLKYVINAGIDLLILANHNSDQTETAIDIIELLVETEEIPYERIEESYNRIIKLKKSYLGNRTCN
ncbi:MAG: glycoside hydrolase family 3 [Verrucomicrobia bacterium]|nr:MAG: glycoside hydrolase family 3 [Verrucomicrobiota bacterium]